MVGKIYSQESRWKSFKAYVKKQDTYCLGCKTRTDNNFITAKQLVNRIIAQNQRVLIEILKVSFCKRIQTRLIFTNYKTCIFNVKTVKKESFLKKEKQIKIKMRYLFS